MARSGSTRLPARNSRGGSTQALGLTAKGSSTRLPARNAGGGRTRALGLDAQDERVGVPGLGAGDDGAGGLGGSACDPVAGAAREEGAGGGVEHPGQRPGREGGIVQGAVRQPGFGRRREQEQQPGPPGGGAARRIGPEPYGPYGAQLG
ncbi:hypothetical protein ACWF95_07185 [Streptomyces vinaceus]